MFVFMRRFMLSLFRIVAYQRLRYCSPKILNPHPVHLMLWQHSYPNTPHRQTSYLAISALRACGENIRNAHYIYVVYYYRQYLYSSIDTSPAANQPAMASLMELFQSFRPSTFLPFSSTCPSPRQSISVSSSRYSSQAGRAYGLLQTTGHSATTAFRSGG